MRAVSPSGVNTAVSLFRLRDCWAVVYNVESVDRLNKQLFDFWLWLYLTSIESGPPVWYFQATSSEVESPHTRRWFEHCRQSALLAIVCLSCAAAISGTLFSQLPRLTRRYATVVWNSKTRICMGWKRFWGVEFEIQQDFISRGTRRVESPLADSCRLGIQPAGLLNHSCFCGFEWHQLRLLLKKSQQHEMGDLCNAHLCQLV